MKEFHLDPDALMAEGPNEQIREALSWRVLTELLRRYPDRFRWLEWHPAGGQSDVLSLIEEGGPSQGISIDLNRVGSAQISRDGAHMFGWQGFWEDAVRIRDPKVLVDVLANKAGLQSISPLPRASAAAILGRVVSAVIGAELLSRSTWSCRSGFSDTSGWISSVRDDFFAAVPAAHRRLQQHEAGDFMGEPAYRFWFLLRDAEPVAAFELHQRGCTGWSADGVESDVVGLYRGTEPGRVWPVVMYLMGKHLA